MKRMRSLGVVAILFWVLIVLSGCTESVSPGYVGMVLEPGGFIGEFLQTGRHSCWGRDLMIILETKEATMTEKLSILCADNLNFRFDLKIRARLKVRNSEQFLKVLNLQGANIWWEKNRGILPFQVLYDTYIKPVARSIARIVVSKYETIQIRDNREAITKAIQSKLTKAMNGTPMEITMVTTSNFDYPDIIIRAFEKKRQREIKIQEERTRQAIKLLQAENRLKIAQKMKVARTAEAEAEAVYIKFWARL